MGTLIIYEIVEKMSQDLFIQDVNQTKLSTYFPVIQQTFLKKVIFKVLRIKQEGFKIVPKEDIWIKDELKLLTSPSDVTESPIHL